MNYADLVNGLFEFVGAIAITFNVFRLLKDKHIAGVHWASTAFFTSWGFYNLFFYPHEGLWMSFAGGVCIVVANSIWIALLFYYTKVKPKHT